MDTTLLLIVVGAAVVVILILGFAALRGARAESAAWLARLAEITEGLAKTQAEFSGKFDEARKTTGERLDALSKRLGDGLTESAEKTGESLRGLHERLAVIDAAQKNITDLSQQMVGLQDILSNKQARGAFGEIQLQDLVTAILPPSAYAMQAKLSNGKIVDCLLNLPNPPGFIAIDAKFPLESYNALRQADGDTEKVRAERAFSADVRKHVRDIEEKYIVPGETAESALMFLPSEAVYAELHANFRGVVENSFRRRVWIVSPTTLMATLNTVRAVLKDAQMKEQAGLIQAEVEKMLVDVRRLDERVDSLHKHFDQAGRDVEQIRTSSKKVTGRGEKIEGMQLEAPAPAEDLAPPQDRLREV